MATDRGPMSVGENSNEAAPLLPTTSANSTPAKVDGEHTPHALLGMTCVALASLCFSFMSTFIKYMTFTFSSMEATFWRSLGVFVCNFIVVKVLRISLYVEPEFRKILVYRCIAGFACMGFAFYTMSQMVLADASSLVFVSPVLTFFMGALFLNEKIDPISLISAVTAFIGLICVVRPGFLFGYDHPTASTDGSWVVAICSALLGAFSQVFVFLTMRHQGFQQSFYIPETFLLWRAIIGTGIATFGGQMFLTRGFQLEKAGVAAVMRYLDVVFVFTWDSLILGEHINHWSIVGALVILTCAVRKIQLTMDE
ncbi:EamA-like transporter family [Phytophthora infestans]|uniref:EamA-like transporter family n=1 Tax=Phytophthora infestans TaxID=4787 RepID=A0A833SKN9_PHYIN|nr:EamA-like transporter family [Phytophthora infestans]